MPVEIFSDAWAKACARELNNRPAYREAAATWEWPVVLTMTVDPPGSRPDRSVFFDLWHGECREARIATEGDLERAGYILTSTREVWDALLQNRLAPVLALMTGKLRLAKGSLAALVPYVNAARELVAATMGVETVSPQAE